ncbi:MAG: hypothetical protein PWP37_1077 [Thermotogota bacterium]|nr:hypothetical protein [Thermotogota bacterium]
MYSPYTFKTLDGMRNSLPALVGSPFGSANGYISDSANAPSKFLTTFGALDTPGTLSEMLDEPNISG